MKFDVPINSSVNFFAGRQKRHNILQFNEINTSKASGPDNLPNMYLKMCAQQLAPALALIFTKSLTSGQLPEDWRNANVVPIFKKGNVHLAENYRPVSLTSVISKLLEHIVCKHLLDHLDRNNVLTHLNHGFRKGFSCETQLMVTMDDLFKQYDNNIQSDIIILISPKPSIPYHITNCYINSKLMVLTEMY